jgi:lipopolysaccharide export system protein LptA
MAGHVHLTRGENQLNGDFGVVNLRTGVSVVTRSPGGRVEGLVVPNDKTIPAAGAAGPKPSTEPKRELNK